MSKKHVGASVIVDRAKLEELLKSRSEILEKVNSNISRLKIELDQQIEQQIGLRHRINELTELLK